jgi:hypothetical protein
MVEAMMENGLPETMMVEFPSDLFTMNSVLDGDPDVRILSLYSLGEEMVVRDDMGGSRLYRLSWTVSFIDNCTGFRTVGSWTTKMAMVHYGDLMAGGKGDNNGLLDSVKQN